MASSRDEAFWAPIGSIFDLTLKFEQIATTGVIFASQIASLVLWAVAAGRRTNTAIPATAIELLAAACLAAIIYIEHRHSIRSSASTPIYLILSLAFEVCRSRSFFLRPGFTVLGSMAAVAAGMRLILLALQEISKRSLLLDDALRQNCGFETTSGFIGRVLFLFLKPVFATGFRAELLLRHLDQLDPELSSEVLYQRLEPHWQPHRLNPSPNELLKACFKAWKDCVGGLVFSRLIVTAFDFSQPFVLRRVINLVDKPHQDNMKERGGVQAAATFMFIGIALSRTTHLHLMNRFVTRLVGLTGAGKSTIVQGILGQSEILGGSVSVNTDEIGYCGENVWLRDITIRENIVGDLEFNQARFTSVIKACFLEEDLQWLPGGADYIVGTNGSNLSGGQRQHVGLARTAYAEHRVTILDDAFSSLDHETAVCILHQLIGRNGIFPRAGCSVFVVTHLPACLDLVDQLLVLEGSRCNVLKERRHIDEYRGKLDVALTTLNHNVAVEKEQREQRALRTSLEGRAASVAFNNAALRQRGDIRLYGLFIRPIGWLKMGLHTALTSLYATGEVVPEIYLRIWIETNPDKSAFFIGYAGVVVATCVLGCLVYWLLYAKLSPRSSSQLHQKLVDSTKGSTLRFLTAGLGTSLVALALFVEQSSSSSSVGLSFMGLIYLNLALQNTLVAWTALETSSGALARLSLFEKETPQEPRRTSEKLPKDWPTKGQVEMRNVFASYTPEDDESSCALRDVSVSIPAGRRIGIMGRSGSGKSSLFLTMLGFISYEGVIEINGVDIASISLDDLRCRIITITQDQVQFDATIRTNLLPFTMNDGPCKLDEKAMKRDMDLEQLLKSLHIWIPLAKKGGLDANLYDVGYSKGQMQLLCIARAIMRQRETGSRLVLIDEGTSSIDERTEKIVNRIMKENFAGCTVLTIAHRSSAVANYDGRLRLDRGATVDPTRESDSESAEEAN
ncbi:hypothetical protein MY8738_006300 [Beauveria namnaoensis]